MASGPTHTRKILTVSDGLHAEAQQCMQEIHYVIEGVFVDILAHCLAKLQLVQLIQVGQAVLCLKGKKWDEIKIYMSYYFAGCAIFIIFH